MNLSTFFSVGPVPATQLEATARTSPTLTPSREGGAAG